MHFMIVEMLKKKLGINAIERDWEIWRNVSYFKIPSTLIIPEGCKRIGMYAFWGCDKLERVEIPKSVKDIGSWAFGGCRNATITLKKLMKDFDYIERGAFLGVRDVKEEVGG